MSISDTEPVLDNAAPLVLEGLLVHGDDGVHLSGAECTRCGTVTFPFQPVCPQCQHTEPRRRELSRAGRVFSFTVVRSRPPNYSGPVPYGLGLVELPERLLVTTMLLAHDLDTLAVGDPVVSTGVDVGADGEPVLSYAFVPAAEQ